MAFFAEESASDVRFLTFNQDVSRLAVGTTAGSHTYKIDPFELLHERGGEGTSIVEMHYSTCLVAHVGSGEGAASSQRALRMINTKTEKLIIQLNYASAILAVKINRERLVVVLETTIYIYDITTMNELHMIDQVPLNPNGVCALACSQNVPGDGTLQNNFFAYPGSIEKGEVYVYDVQNLKAFDVIEAHNSPISCLAFSPSGETLATASGKGTVIRVFATPSGEKLFELRRGIQTSAQIFSMAFSEDASLLSVSSDKATVHIFKLEVVNQAPAPAANGGMMDYFSSTITSAASSLGESILPKSVSDIWQGQRNFAQATLPNAGSVNMCALRKSPNGKVDCLLVVTYDGYLYKFALPDVGGEAVLEVTHALGLHKEAGAALAGGMANVAIATSPTTQAAPPSAEAEPAQGGATKGQAVAQADGEE